MLNVTLAKMVDLNEQNTGYIEEQYERYRSDPQSLSLEWRRFFEGFEMGRSSGQGLGPGHIDKEVALMNMINAYRARGHLIATTNPVRPRRVHNAALSLDNFALAEEDLETEFSVGGQIKIGRTSLKNILAHLRSTYCSSIGVEYGFLPNSELRCWLENRMESQANRPKFDIERKKAILSQLVNAVGFEEFLNVKYVGQKRYSLEGAEAFIPACHALIRKGAELGVRECIVGMAHRGRLNFLVNILDKPLDDVFSEFEWTIHSETAPGRDEGDVKYHKGHSLDLVLENGKPIHIALMYNPSHLEAINPVIIGNTKAKVTRLYHGDYRKIVPILIHGDASIAGQGVNYELANLSRVRGYETGGTIHLVINNQVGFTTNYDETRSSLYCTDLAKMIQAPVFHVNADDPEALVYVAELAMELRQQFAIDVYIDLLAYRRQGHNEGDDPKFTQPLLYRRLEKHPNVLAIYRKKLIKENDSTEAEIDMMIEKHRSILQIKLEQARAYRHETSYDWLHGQWSALRPSSFSDFARSPSTGVIQERVGLVAEALCRTPEHFQAYARLDRLLAQRRQLFFEKRIADWALAEQLAFGSLLLEKIPVRLSGQDSRRGTFAQRHAVFFDTENEREYIPLNHIEEGQAEIGIYNSILSENAVLGFEYGYSTALPNELVLWEAQFGDFANGAQVIIDQFIVSSEQKWRRMSGIVMLLPHGYEGQGPDHSSARLERYLQLCAGENIIVANPTTPVNYFHLLRRQIRFPFRKPLIVMTPKSLLRHPKMFSALDKFSEGCFEEIIDRDNPPVDEVTRLILCSGKIFYDLDDERVKRNDTATAIIRIEQLNPFPRQRMSEMLSGYSRVEKIFYIQEEPANMGAWPFLSLCLNEWKPLLIARKESPSPATGVIGTHLSEQRKIVERAFA